MKRLMSVGLLALTLSLLICGCSSYNKVISKLETPDPTRIAAEFERMCIGRRGSEFALQRLDEAEDQCGFGMGSNCFDKARVRTIRYVDVGRMPRIIVTITADYENSEKTDNPSSVACMFGFPPEYENYIENIVQQLNYRHRVYNLGYLPNGVGQSGLHQDFGKLYAFHIQDKDRYKATLIESGVPKSEIDSALDLYERYFPDYKFVLRYSNRLVN